jgi:hypothetical protein
LESRRSENCVFEGRIREIGWEKVFSLGMCGRLYPV